MTKPIYKTTLSWLPKKTFELTITIPKEEVQKTYHQVLKKIASETEIKFHQNYL